MFRPLMILTVLVTALTVSLPARAQESDEFFSVLRENLEGEAAPEDAQSEPAAIRMDLQQPALGASEVLEGVSVPKSATETYGAYDAGSEHVSGTVAATAAFLAVLAVVFIFALALTNKHEGKE